MRTEYIDDEYVLRLNRSELVLLISSMIEVEGWIKNDEMFQIHLGWDRERFLRFRSELADFCRAFPPAERR